MRRLALGNAILADAEALPGWPLTQSELAAKLGVTVQNLQTAPYMRPLAERVRRLHRHRRRIQCAPEPGFDGAAERGAARESSAPGLGERPAKSPVSRRSFYQKVLQALADWQTEQEIRVRRDAERSTYEDAQKRVPAACERAGIDAATVPNALVSRDLPDALGAAFGADKSRAGEITIYSAAEAARVQDASFDGVLIIDSPDNPALATLDFKLAPFRAELRFADLATEGGQGAPDAAGVEDAVRFARGLEQGHLLICSWRGISRAPAVALAILADRLGRGREREAVAEVMRRAPRARFNPLVVKCADRLLARDGELAAAVRAVCEEGAANARAPPCELRGAGPIANRRHGGCPRSPARSG